jgi:Domain of unknown function (DUF4338)/Transposase Tn5 dimerisation domain/Transposase DNA-binding
VTVCGQKFSREILRRIQQAIDEDPALRRGALSRRVCEWLNWRTPVGKLKEVSCRVALLKLDRGGQIQLPAAGPAVLPSARRVRAEPERRAEEVPSETSLETLQPVSLVRIQSADSAVARVWKELMNRDHYLGAGPLCGAQMRYLLRSGRGEWLGGLAFSAAAWRVEARDHWIGWSSEARRQQLYRVIGNSRFLILPRWRVPHLASQALGLALRQIARDWQERYGYEPLLVETFVEAERFAGTCYRAANWIEVGQTSGRGRQDREHRGRVPVKRVFVYPLQEGAREKLGGGEPPPAPTPRDWAEEEFGGAALGDERLKRRLLILARDLYARPQANLPQACRTRAGTKAAYRFLDHDETQMDVLLEPHTEATCRRVAAEPLVLAVQDTTSLNYSAHPATENLGPIGSKKEGVMGLLVHSTMAFNAEGTPLGLLQVQHWVRDPAAFGQKHRRKQRPLEEKESVKWLKSFRGVAEVQRRTPGTRLVSVGDRESDVYELFQEALADPKGPGLLIRAEQDRLLNEGQGHLCAHLTQQPCAGVQEIQVPRHGAQAARRGRLEVRFAQVTLRPPKGRKSLGPLTLWAVLAQEEEAPSGIKPLRWLLLTTCVVESFEAACEKLRWYTLRWGIEVYHRTLKSGCQIEQRQLGSADRIEACLAIDLVVAWRIFHLAKLGREIPEVPCTVFFEEAEWKALVAYVTHNPTPPERPPSLREAMRMVASLGGFLGRKSDGEPGTKTLWLGLQELDTATAMWKILTHHSHSPPVSSRRYG